jgi:2-hydroxy-6-oxonona-2,4-dienedioate hydrolase
MNENAYRKAERALWAALGLEPTERQLDLPRIGSRVRVQEVGDGPPVVFIHGGPDSGSSWAPLLEHLTDWRAIVLDRPGTGLSDPLPSPLALDDAPGFGPTLLEDVLDALGIESTHVVGSSFGSYLALHASAAVPERIDRVVHLGCPALVPGMATPPFMRAMAVAPVRWLLSVLPPSRAGARSIMRQIGHGKSLAAGAISDEFLAWYIAKQRHTDTMANDTAMIASAVTVRGFVPSATIADEVLGAAKAPACLIWGADDTFGGEDVAVALAEMLPDAELHLLADAGHLPWLDDPVRCAELTAAFLAG